MDTYKSSKDQYVIMVKDDIEALPPIPYEPIEQDSSMPDMGNDESEVITGNDWVKV